MSQASEHTGAGRQSLVEDNHLVIPGGESEGRLARARQTVSRAIVPTQPTYRISISSGNFILFRIIKLQYLPNMNLK
jgi:hypothetical protein